jgi:RNA binding exosome subunit
MSKKQTAIEFLIKAFQGAYGEKVINIISVQVEQAKAMEKEQLLDMGNQFAIMGEDSPEQYYNETYN